MDKMNILYFVMGLLFISVGFNIIQYWLTVDLRHTIYELSAQIVRLSRYLEILETTRERNITND
jgi:hypothetical protein